MTGEKYLNGIRNVQICRTDAHIKQFKAKKKEQTLYNVNCFTREEIAGTLNKLIYITH